MLVLVLVGTHGSTARAEPARAVQPTLSSYTGWGEGSLISHLGASLERLPSDGSGLALALRGEVAWLGAMAGRWHVDGELGAARTLGDGNPVAMGLSIRHARNLEEAALSYADEVATSRTALGFTFAMRGAGEDVAVAMRFSTHLYGVSGAGFDVLIGPSLGRHLELGLLLRLDTVIGSGAMLGGTLRL